MQRLIGAGQPGHADVFSAWAKFSEREFYEGDLEIGDDGRKEFALDKSLCYPASLTRLVSRCSLAYRRTWRHIRANKVGSRVIWFVKSGSLHLARSRGSCEVTEGWAAILDSSTPFHAKAKPGPDGVYESYQLTIPGHMYLVHLQDSDRLLEPFDLASPEGSVVQDLLDILITSGERLSRRSAEPMVDTVLEAVGDCFGDRETNTPARQRLVDKRLADIINYIMMNLSDPELSYDRVARNCEISPRYLCYLLKANNTSFSELVWKNRLPKARDLLLSAATRDYPIHEIAYMCGFKSAAHFSRMFTATYGCPPRKFRLMGGAVEASPSTAPAVGDDIGVAKVLTLQAA